jgi:hypothetical protein
VSSASPELGSAGNTICNLFVIGAATGVGFCILAGRRDDHEDHESDDQKIDYGVRKLSVSNDWNWLLPCPDRRDGKGDPQSL